MILTFPSIVTAAWCIGIMVACICRVGAMTASRHKWAWAIMYIAMGAFALGETLDALLIGIWPAEHTMAGLLGIGLNLILTQRHWRQGPPEITCKR